jgi:hypothetical protein
MLLRGLIGGSIYSALQCSPTAVIAAVFPYRSPQKEFPLNAAQGGLQTTPESRLRKINPPVD